MNNKPTYEELEAKITEIESENEELNRQLLHKQSLDKKFILRLLDTIPNPVFYKDCNGIYQNCNDAFSKMILGIPKEMIIGKTLFDLPDVIPHKLAVIYHEKDKDLYLSSGTQTYEGSVKCADNIMRSFLFYKATVENDSNEVIGIVGVMLDVTELKDQQTKLDEKNKLLEKLSYTDPLTGVFNRRKFDEVFVTSLKSAKRYKRLISFIIVDVDNFKLYNDTYGHHEGDVVLKRISDVILSRLGRPDDYMFRLGGEEFGLLYHSSDEEKSLEFANKIREDVENLNITHKNNSYFGKITISLGLTIIKNKNDTPDFIYEEADKLLYKAKNAGRNCIKSGIL